MDKAFTVSEGDR